MPDGLLPWFLIVPLVGSALALCGKTAKRAERILCLASVASLLGLFVVLFQTFGPISAGETLRCALGGWPEPRGIALMLDGFAWVSVLLISLISFFVALYSLGDGSYGSHYFFFLLLMIAGMLGVTLTGDLFTMFVCFEIVAVAGYVLIAFDGTTTGLVASFKYLMLSSTGILFFLLGIFLIYRDLGMLSITALQPAFEAAGGARGSVSLHLGVVSLCVGIGVRTAFIPFHTWLPEAHAYAPHPVSALLSGVLIKVSFFAMARILFASGGEYLFTLLLWIGACTAITAVFSALAQSDAKRLLAYHSISQMGYILAVFAAEAPLSIVAAFSHAINHAAFKSLLFLTVGAAIHITGERDIFRMRPLGRAQPLLAAAFCIGALSISGVPPFNGFASKALISAGMKDSPAYLLLWITGFATLASFIKLGRIFLPGPASVPAAPVIPATTAGNRGAAAFISVPITCLAALCILTGVFGTPTASALCRLLAPSQAIPLPALYTLPKLAAFVPTLILGIAAYRLLMSSPGKKIAGRFRRLMPDLQTVLLLFFAGLICFAATGFF